MGEIATFLAGLALLSVPEPEMRLQMATVADIDTPFVRQRCLPLEQWSKRPNVRLKTPICPPNLPKVAMARRDMNRQSDLKSGNISLDDYPMMEEIEPSNSTSADVLDALNGNRQGELRIDGHDIFAVNLRDILAALRCPGKNPADVTIEYDYSSRSRRFIRLDGPTEIADVGLPTPCFMVVRFNDTRSAENAVTTIRRLLTAHTASLGKTDADATDFWLRPELRGGPSALFPISGLIRTGANAHRFVVVALPRELIGRGLSPNKFLVRKEAWKFRVATLANEVGPGQLLSSIQAAFRTLGATHD